ncbi:MAG: HAD family hydrolase [Lachnospiraceae bacterium]|nr:HAD family hydrolase [Lachnospiraceae bacterium]
MMGCRKPNPVVFLDRDGVLAVEKSYVRSREDLEIFPYAGECVKTIHEKGYLAIVVTNQSGVARGYFTEAQLQEMNRYLMQETGVDAVYYCPHHEKGVVRKYACQCQCRKPAAGMIWQACRDFDIDMADIGNSYMVGDRASDIQLGQNAGLTTVLLESGYGTQRLEQQITPSHICMDLADFTRNILIQG